MTDNKIKLKSEILLSRIFYIGCVNGDGWELLKIGQKIQNVDGFSFKKKFLL